MLRRQTLLSMTVFLKMGSMDEPKTPPLYCSHIQTLWSGTLRSACFTSSQVILGLT